ncbi:hypothetical protein D918_08573 [Trichuris suis]|nr:hypothetical protein D918_08573 [Trichuris suis]
MKYLHYSLRREKKKTCSKDQVRYVYCCISLKHAL